MFRKLHRRSWSERCLRLHLWFSSNFPAFVLVTTFATVRAYWRGGVMAARHKLEIGIVVALLRISEIWMAR